MSTAYEELFTVPIASRFDEFWDAWPSHHRKVAKPQCETKWRNHGLDAIAEKIIAHVQACKQTDSWVAGYVPMPATYLNQRRWEASVEKRVTVDNSQAAETARTLAERDRAWNEAKAKSTLDVRALRAQTLARLGRRAS